VFKVQGLMRIARVAALGLALQGCGQASGDGDGSGARMVLKVPHLRQETLLCVPTSAAMVLAYYGDPQPPRRLKSLASGRNYDPQAPFSDYSMTRFQDLIRAVESLGYAWTEKTYPDTPEGAEIGLREIETQLSMRRPVMVDVTLPAGGHTVVVEGFDPEARTLFIVDPDAPAPGRRAIGYDQFAAIWNEHAYGGQFRGLIVTRPKSPT
jgi:hypothetical protein